MTGMLGFLCASFLFFVAVAQPVTCPDLCNASSSQRFCNSFTATGQTQTQFAAVAAPAYIYFAMKISTGGLSTPLDFSFTNQQITIPGYSLNPVDSFISVRPPGQTSVTCPTLSGGATSGSWTMTGSNAAGCDLFVSGYVLQISSAISAFPIGNFVWCGLIQQSTAQTLTNLTFAMSATVYSSFPSYCGASNISSTVVSCNNPNFTAGHPNGYDSFALQGGTRLPEVVREAY